jgi:hypothetical protein
MEIFKKLSAAVVLAILVGLPLALLESLTIYSVIKLYEIPYLCNFKYYQIMGLSFVIMMTRNRIRFNEDTCEGKDDVKVPSTVIINQSLNRLFRVAFVWGVALVVHYLFFNFK